MSRSFLKAALPALVLATIGLVHSLPAAAAGDAARGKQLGYTCLGCHGVETYKNVYPTFSVPRLRGQRPEYIAASLRAYRTGERSHGTMHAHAASLSDQDIDDVAAYLAGTVVTAPANAAPKGTPPTLATTTCQSCHGSVGVGVDPSYPTLSGQYADYLQYALESYRNGSRKNAIMLPFVQQLRPEDIAELAKFYSRQQPALKTVPRNER